MTSPELAPEENTSVDRFDPWASSSSSSSSSIDALATAPKSVCLLSILPRDSRLEDGASDGETLLRKDDSVLVEPEAGEPSAEGRRGGTLDGTLNCAGST